MTWPIQKHPDLFFQDFWFYFFEKFRTKILTALLVPCQCNFLIFPCETFLILRTLHLLVISFLFLSFVLHQNSQVLNRETSCWTQFTQPKAKTKCPFCSFAVSLHIYRTHDIFSFYLSSTSFLGKGLFTSFSVLRNHHSLGL